MKSVNSTLIQKLYDLLSPVVGVPVYKKYILSHVTDPAYVLLSDINSNDASTMHSFDTDSAVQIGIYTKDSQANPGKRCDEIADLIYGTIFTSPQALIDLSPDFQNCVLRRQSDVSPQPV